MLARPTDTPTARPRPPAKMRRRLSLAALKSTSSSSSERSRVTGITSSPPPAYASTPGDELVPPDSRPFPETLLGSPVPSTFRFKPLESPAKEWIDEKSREELAELLVKAEDIIKERENELGVTATIAKNLYESNVALKTKHEAFVARLPLSPSPRPPPSLSPEDPSHTPAHSESYFSMESTSEHFESPPSPAPPPPFYRRHARRVSMSTTEISLLADQNAELMDKLQQLEAESNSADQAGRRELKRLEKEIASLREVLEKTQAKSEELEEKTKGLDKGIDRVVEDAWKRKKEREMRFQALKSAGREESRVRDFAPRGSAFGHYAFSRSMSSLHELEDDEAEVDEDETLTNDKVLFVQPEHEIINQLLRKVQELEETNSKILKQQQETSNQLQAVQRDTEQMTKVYEYLGDPQDIDIEVEESELHDRDFSSNFRGSLSRTSSNPHTTRRGRNKTRSGVVGLFDESTATPSNTSTPSLSSPWNDSRHRGAYSLDNTGLVSPALSTLSFLNSPQQFGLDDISPIAPGRTLDAELSKHFKSDNAWGSQRDGFHHLRTHSLSNLSLWSVPTSPAPSSPSTVPIQGLPGSIPSSGNVPVVVEPSPLPTPPHASLRLSVNPPTPEKRLRPSASGASLRPQDQYQPLHPGGKSPRQQFISQRIRDRRARWEDERFGSLSSISSSVWESSSSAKPDPVFIAPTKLRVPEGLRSRSSSSTRIPRRITSIVDSLVDRFDDAAATTFARENTPDTESGYEESDEGDYDGVSEGFEDSSFEEPETTEYEDDEYEVETENDETDLHTPHIAEDNALQLHQMRATRSPPSGRPRSATTTPRVAAAAIAGGAGGQAASKKGTQGKWGNVLLELWLWLQFAVIIFVFLFAMAKRGPKAVLADAERTQRTRKVSLHAKKY